MIGSAKQCMMDLYFTVWPSSSTGMLCVKIHRLLSETVSNNKTTINTEVVHAGMASNIHMSVAKAKIEISLCSIIVSPRLQNVSTGRNHNTKGYHDGDSQFYSSRDNSFSASLLAFSILDKFPPNGNREKILYIVLVFIKIWFKADQR